MKQKFIFFPLFLLMMNAVDLNQICMKCGVCCENTEMELSEKDIRRILKIIKDNPQLKQFYIIDKTTGEKKLRNINGRCIFQNPEDLSCKIYENRPEGCKFYPLIYDCSSNKCTLDEECPNRNLFYQDENERYLRCKELRAWIFKELIKKQ